MLKKTGADYLIKSIEKRTTITRYPNGNEVEKVVQRFRIEDRRAALELLGKQLDIWKDSMDPDEVFERLLGIPRGLLPAKLDDSIEMRLGQDGSYAAPKE